jgi:hypothetical protein
MNSPAWNAPVSELVLSIATTAGRLDIVRALASTVERFQKGGDLMVTLWHQEPNGTFKDISRQAGLSRKEMGFASADFDHDGKRDLYLPGYGEMFSARSTPCGIRSRAGLLCGPMISTKTRAARTAWPTSTRINSLSICSPACDENGAVARCSIFRHHRLLKPAILLVPGPSS